ncbi:MAG: molybdopterin-binding protein [Oscillospiraceae bacterium]|nr:molybdopterin-binding protein [Oscillospiraceae bacterium]
MKLIRTEDAVGHVICHDITQIIPGVTKDARFRKGHVVSPDDIPVLLSMGKEHLYVWEKKEGFLHENDAAERLIALCRNDGMDRTETKEGKIELTAAEDGLFCVDTERLFAVNVTEDIMIATRHGNTAVKKGDKLCGVRIIPLVISEDILKAAEAAAGKTPLLEIIPRKLKTAGIVVTGSEVAKGRIKDKFSPVVEKKLKEYGVSVNTRITVEDDTEKIKDAVLRIKAEGVDMILCSGGMSVDPDDKTPGAIKAAGAKIISYGAPVLPGAMFLLGYFENGVPIMGLPGCVMYSKATVFDLLLPRIVSGVPVSRRDTALLGHGGLCLGCKTCSYPVCPFGKGR